MWRLLVLLVVAPCTSWSAIPGLRLGWAAPEGCPQQVQFERSVARLIGDVEPDLAIDVATRVEPGDTWWVELRTEGGVRRLKGVTCQAVLEAAVVVVALMIDPLARVEAAPLDPEPSRSWSLGLWATIDTHSLPAPSPGLSLVAALELGRGFSGELQALGWLPQARTVDGFAGATVVLFAGAIGARRDFTFGSFTLSPVFALEAGAQRGRSFGVSSPDVAAGFWAAARAGAALGFAFGRLRFGLRAEVAVPLIRPTFIVGGVGVVHTSSPVVGRGALTIELLFPPRVQGAPRN